MQLGSVMHSYGATAEAMENVACVLEKARLEGRDPTTALRITRVTLNYVAGWVPTSAQLKTIAALDESLRELRRTHSA